MNNLQFLAIIPARFASTRFPGKPLAMIGDKPMIQRVYEQALLALDHVVVATDDARIEQAVKNFGGNVVMTSPDHQSGTDRCAEALTVFEKLNPIIKIDVVINIQGDEPFIQPKQIKSVMECFQNPKTQIATLVKKIDNKETLFDANKPKVVIDNDGMAIYFSRSPIPYLRGAKNENWYEQHAYYKHIGMYAYRADALHQITKLPQSSLELIESLEQLRWIQNDIKIKVAETDYESPSVDTPADLEAILAQGLI